MIILKGEFVIIVEGAQEKEYSNAGLLEMLQAELDKDKSRKDAIKKVMEKNRCFLKTGYTIWH